MAAKPYWKRILTIRWLRWIAFRAALAVVPGLARALRLPDRSVDTRDVAQLVLEDTCHQAVVALDDDLRRTIIEPAARAEGIDADAYMARAFALHDVCAIVPQCEINGRIMAAVHTPQNGLLGMDASVRPNWNAAKPGALRARKADPHLHYAAFSSRAHYYHFLADDVLPLFHFLRMRCGELGSVRVVLAANPPRFVLETLLALQRAFPCLSWEELGSGELISEARVLYAKRGSQQGVRMVVDAQDLVAFRGLMFAHYGLDEIGPAQEGRRLYVSRAGARVRNLHNEEVLRRSLEAGGFERIVPAASNHREQIRCFHESDVIVAVHGAALANLIYCRPGAAVVELFAANQLRPLYLWLSLQLGLRYRAVVGGRNDLWQNFSVEVSEVLRETEAAQAVIASSRRAARALTGSA